MTITSIRPELAVKEDPFLLETIATDALIVGVGEDIGPVARTCNCYGSCGPTLCAGHCCTHGSTTCLER
jgi:hypothetical protein